MGYMSNNGLYVLTNKKMKRNESKADSSLNESGTSTDPKGQPVSLKPLKTDEALKDLLNRNDQDPDKLDKADEGSR